MIAYIRARLNERSTWGFWFGGVSTVAAMPYPANVFLGIALLAVGFLPDGTVLPGKNDG